MYLLIRRIALFYFMTTAVASGGCVQSEHCHCVQDDIYYDLHCEMTFPYLEVTGNDTEFRRFYISADTNHYRVEGRFKNVHVNHVFITGSNVTELDCDLLRGLTGVSSVDIIDTKLSRIPTCTLHESTNITSLSIINSQINELPRRAFAVLPNIKRIVLSHNCLTHIRLDTFYGVDHLTSLDLSFNCLSGSFTSEPLSHLTQLTNLNLSHNNVSLLNLRFFDYVGASVSSNFSSIGSNLTQAHIDFSWNRISKITRFQIQVRPSDFDHTSFNVDLSHNELEEIPAVSLDETEQSHISFDLNISHNHIILFDRDPLTCNFCRKVTLRLSIANNNMKSFPLCYLRIIEKYNIQLLNFSHNFIEGSVNRLCGAEALHILDVSSNILTAVGELGFEGKPSQIRELYLSGNLISAIEKSDMANVAETLKIVDLTNNSLSDYQQIVDSFPNKLTHIALSDNPFNCTFNHMFWENQTVCLSRDLFSGARCAQPMVFRGMQVMCLPRLNCSNVQSCEQDTYMELSLNTKFKHEALYLHWEAIGPGIDKVSEFILTILNKDLNNTHSQVFVHRLSRNYTVAPIPTNAIYKCCIEAVILNMTTDQSCYLADTETDNDIEQTNYIVLITGTTIGITAANVGISLLVWRVCKRRHKSIQQTTPKQFVDEEWVNANQTLPNTPQVSSGQMIGINSDVLHASEDTTPRPIPVRVKQQKRFTVKLVKDKMCQTDVQMRPLASEGKMTYLIPSHHEEAGDISTTDSDIGYAVSLSSANAIVSSCGSSPLLSSEESEEIASVVLNTDYKAVSSPEANETSEDTVPKVVTGSTPALVGNLRRDDSVVKVLNSLNRNDKLYDFPADIVNEASDDTYPKVLNSVNNNGSEYQSMELTGIQEYYLNVHFPTGHKIDICYDSETSEVNKCRSGHPIPSGRHIDTSKSEESNSHSKEARTKNPENPVTIGKLDTRDLGKQPGPIVWENPTTGESCSCSVSSAEYFASALLNNGVKGTSDA